MSLEHLDCHREIDELNDKIEFLESNNEDLKYFYKKLLESYAKLCSSEGYGDYNHITNHWLKEIENK